MFDDALALKARAELARLKELERLQAEEKKLDEYRRDPLLYFEERLGIRRETIDWELNEEYRGQEWDGTRNPFVRVLEAIGENRWVGVESATGTGKTHFGALLVLWFLECFENSIVVTTAPKQDQLALHIWKEIGALLPKFGRGEMTQLRLRMIPGEDRWLALGFVAGVF